MAPVVAVAADMTAVDVARYRIACESADHRSPDNAAKTSVRRGATDRATAHSAQHCPSGVVVVVAVCLGRDDFAANTIAATLAIRVIRFSMRLSVQIDPPAIRRHSTIITRHAAIGSES